MSGRAIPSDLEALARLAGVQTEYRAHSGQIVRVDPETVLGVLSALGLPVSRVEDVAPVLAEARMARSARLLEPVLVQRGGEATASIPSAAAADPAGWSMTLTCEDGRSGRGRLADLLVAGSSEGPLARLPTPGGEAIAPGYHEVALEGPGLVERALLVAAPRCPEPRRGWGVFMPLYALRTGSDWGSGSYPDLGALGRWTRSVGGAFVGMLPLYPAFLDPPCDPSPYLPVTRLGVNELYVDPTSVPELESAPAARALLGSADFLARVAGARQSESVPYEELTCLRREAIEAIARELLASGRGEAELVGFAERRPDMLAYARFRASGERHGRDWRSWPAGAADGAREAPLADPVVRYHLCAQWLAHRQLAEAAEAADLYGDLPVGVHPLGFDPYFEPGAFATGAQGGAPPDGFYAGGQAWALPPLHPEGIRTQRYRHLIAVLRSAFAHLRTIRVDHVMGLHRMYWIPDGHDARHGAYVSYRADELRAVVALEAHRAGAVVVGEDLGTVDASVREAMAADRMLRTWVFEFKTSSAEPLPEPPAECIASVGSHDVPRFAAFWRGADPGEPNDTEDLLAGRIDADRARERTAWRRSLAASLGLDVDAAAAATPESERLALQGILGQLTASPAPLVLVDLQDLWGEIEQENRPGTGPEAANWRHRSRLDLDQLETDPQVGALCSLVEGGRALRAPRGACVS